MRNLFCLALFAFGLMCSAWGQELLVPLRYNVSRSQMKVSGELLRLPFFDDFSNYEGEPNPMLWEKSGAFVSADYAATAPTVGMVTLDAINSDGELYHRITEPFSADTLMSRTIRLDSVFEPQARRLSVGDSVVLSFFYAPAGVARNAWEVIGDGPGPEDSLLLEFYNPALSRWELVWSASDIDVDSLLQHSRSVWQWCSVKITNAEYLDSNFRFRFRNICSLNNVTTQGLVGNSDQWNIDYVWLNINRSCMDTTVRDVAFVDKAPSLLKRYWAMPARQYRTSDMVDSVVLRVVNWYEQQLSTSYSYEVYDEEDRLVNSSVTGHENVPAWIRDSVWLRTSQYLANTVDFSYPESVEPKKYRIVHVVKEGVSGDIHVENDTVSMIQSLENYYAYDDGKAEKGYGITANTSVKFAYQIDLREPDTLSALDMYFNRSLDGYNEQAPFYICVWSDNGGKPGSLIYKDETRRYAKFKGLNTFCRYNLEQLVPISGRVYVGIQQASNGFINIGFDCNSNASNYIFYQAGGAWQRTILSGAIMMRPYMGRAAWVNIADVYVEDYLVKPNVTSSCFTVNDCLEYISVYDIQGRKVVQVPGGAVVDVSGWPKGLYVVASKGKIQKLIVK